MSRTERAFWIALVVLASACLLYGLAVVPSEVVHRVFGR